MQEFQEQLFICKNQNPNLSKESNGDGTARQEQGKKTGIDVQEERRRTSKQKGKDKMYIHRRTNERQVQTIREIHGRK